jgi:hypothetical protein
MGKPKEGYNINMSYSHYKKGRKNALPRHLYREVCKEVNKGIADACKEGFHVNLPAKLGILKVIKRKTNLDNLRVDFNATKKAGKTIFHLNLHSDGWYGSWKWKRFTSIIGRSYHYMFKPTEDNRTSVAKQFKEAGGHKQYTT